ncbi:hypothetical protein D4R78_02590 [bacterium]|nr:MAG: hypothetical protein D4R78_02590 [bacterium]
MNFKKIIIREILVLLGFILLIIFLVFIPRIALFVENSYDKYIAHQDIVWQDNPMLENKVYSSIAAVIFCYPIYLLIRFIIWVARALKTKE